MQIDLSLIRMRRRLLTLAGIVAAIGVAVEVIDALVSPSWGPVLVPLLSLSYEHNLPTWYAVCLWLCCALAVVLIALDGHRRGAPYGRSWSMLAAICAYISVDELVQLHERASDWFDTGGVLYFGWVIPASIVVLLVGLGYVGFLRALPQRTRRQFLLAGGVFISGALLMELPLGYWTEQAGADNLTYALIDSVEEALELVGTSLFLSALLEVLAGNSRTMRLAFSECTATDPTEPSNVETHNQGDAV